MAWPPPRGAPRILRLESMSRIEEPYESSSYFYALARSNAPFGLSGEYIQSSGPSYIEYFERSAGSGCIYAVFPLFYFVS